MGGLTESAKEKSVLLIKEGEGLMLEKYRDTLGYETIGYGHKILEGEELESITEEQAQQILKQDMQKAIDQVQQYWGDALNDLSSERQAVLIDMTFNCGSIRWPMLTKAINQKDYDKAGLEILNSKYASQVGRRAKRNAAIMRDGEMYTNDNYPS